MKDYFDFLTWADFYIAVPMLLFSIFLQWKMLSRWSVLTYRSFLLIFLVNIWFVFVAMLSYVKGATPYYPDVELFSRIITTNHYPYYQSEGVLTYFFLSFPIRFLSVFSILPHLVIQILLYFVSILLIWRSYVRWAGFCNVAILDKVLPIYIVLCSCFPAALLFVPIATREYMFVFGFALLIYSLIRRLTGSGWVVFFTVSLIFVFGTRPQLVAALPFMMLYGSKSFFRNLFFVLFVLILCVLSFPYLTGRSFGPENFALVRNALVAQFAYTGFTYGSVVWTSYFDMVLDLPLLWLQFVLAPFPLLHSVSLMSTLAATADMFFCFLIYLLCFNLRRDFAPYLCFFMVLTLLFSLWEFFIVDAIRHRLVLILLLLPYAASRIVKLLKL